MRGIILLACIAVGQSIWVKNMENIGAYQGDIVLDPDERELMKSSNSYGSIRGGRWPGAKIPYVISSYIGSYGKNVINKAIAQYHKYTCLRFRRRTNERSYINFINGGGCSSPVGYRADRVNRITLPSGCQRVGIAMHEMGHSIGLFHEQSRPDRDNYVSIMWGNIQGGMGYNFNKMSNINSLGTPYDFRSMMHYGATAFGGGRRTIQTKDPSNQRLIGNRSGFSSIDIKQINLMYCGGKPPQPTPTQGPSGGCDNKKSSCLAWAQNGYCNDRNEGQYMKDNCCKACKESAACPNKHSYCNYWTGQGYCQRSKWMTQYCRKACKLCT